MNRRTRKEALMQFDEAPPARATEVPANPALAVPPHMLPTLQLLAMHAMYQMAFEQVERDLGASSPRSRPEPHWN